MGERHKILGKFQLLFNLSSEVTFSGHTVRLMGKMWRKENEKWDFRALGEPLRAKNISETLQGTGSQFLNQQKIVYFNNKVSLSCFATSGLFSLPK
jgi:hypothetical protein